MSVKVAELMSDAVVTTQPHKSIDHVRGIMVKNKISAVPIVNTEEEPVGIVSSSDMVSDLNGSSPISALMTKKVYTVPMYDDVSIAARVMRNHRIHRVLVTHEKKLVGILSAFDLLKLVEEHRYVAKNPPTKSKRRGAKRQ
jgi:CBS domain-containing protein